MAKIISVVSGKGGTGKSTMSSAISKKLSLKGYKCLVVDLDVGLRSLDILLQLEDKVIFDIGDILDERCKIEDAIVFHSNIKNLALLCSPISVSKNFNTEKLINLIKNIKKAFDYIILDTPAGIGLSVVLTKELADLCLVVTTADAVTVRDARKISDVIDANCQKEKRLIINKISADNLSSSGYEDLDSIIDIIGVQLIGVVLENQWINSNDYLTGKKKKLSLQSHDIFNAIASRIDGEYVPLVVPNLI